jgi:acyl-CoA thioesterase-1
VAVGAIGAAALWWRQSTPPPAISAYEGSGPQLAVLGDSITFVSAEAIDAALKPRYALSMSAVVGVKTDGQMATAKRYAGTRPDVVVINLGTNDALQGVDVDRYEREMAKMVSMFPDSCVIVTTIVTHPIDPTDYEQRAAAYDAYLRTLPHVADWDARVAKASRTGLQYLADAVHPNADGQRAYAELIRETADACAPRG